MTLLSGLQIYSCMSQLESEEDGRGYTKQYRLSPYFYGRIHLGRAYIAILLKCSCGELSPEPAELFILAIFVRWEMKSDGMEDKVMPHTLNAGIIANVAWKCKRQQSNWLHILG